MRTAGDPSVVLVHGLGRTHRAMWALEWSLQRHGYRVINWRYPSTRESIAQLAVRMDRELTGRLRAAAGPVHFVTHSMGGLVVRAYLGQVVLPAVGRVVMLAPPNQGSEVADRLRDWWIFRLATGPAGAELITDPSGPAALPHPNVEVGIIAGSHPANPLFARWIGAPNDGKVAVERTRLPGMADFLVVPHGHTLLPWMPGVLRQVRGFLGHGAFDRPLHATSPDRLP